MLQKREKGSENSLTDAGMKLYSFLFVLGKKRVFEQKRQRFTGLNELINNSTLSILALYKYRLNLSFVLVPAIVNEKKGSMNESFRFENNLPLIIVPKLMATDKIGGRNT